MSTLPSLTELIDDTFVSTWYKIRPMAIDNILDARPVTAALRAMGVMQRQIGGRFLTETIAYGEETAEATQKGALLPAGEPDLDTMARWTWRYFTAPVQASIIDDQQNQGEFRIKSYVQRRLQAARDAMEQKLEARLLASVTTDESGLEMQGLYDVIPPYASRATGTFGQIARSNSWWQPNYKKLNTPYEVHLLDDMRKLYRYCHKNQEAVDLLLFSEELFDIYEAYAEEKTQIVVQAGGNSAMGRVADLGFPVLRFKGKMMIWSENVTANTALFLNTNYLKLMIDPNYFMVMGDFKPGQRTNERVAHILSTCNMTSNQLRRHGSLDPAATDSNV